LAANSKFVWEFGDGQTDTLKTALSDHGYQIVQLQKDLTARERLLIGTHHG